MNVPWDRSNIGDADKEQKRVGVLFVCMGNICRSPIAEGVFRRLAAQRGLINRLRIDSAGTHDYHCGEPPDRRAIQYARRRRYEIEKLRARKVSVEDFSSFDWIVAMDRTNLRELEALRPADYQGHLGLLLDFAPEMGVREVPDPYYGSLEGFDRVLDLVEPAIAGLLERVAAELRKKGPI